MKDKTSNSEPKIKVTFTKEEVTDAVTILLKISANDFTTLSVGDRAYIRQVMELIRNGIPDNVIDTFNETIERLK